MCDECLPLWELPRSPDADEPRGRTHGIEACLFTTIAILKTGHSDLEMEAVSEMSHGLINIEFKRMLGILDKILEPEMSLLKDWEKDKCRGAENRHLACYIILMVVTFLSELVNINIYIKHTKRM